MESTNPSASRINVRVGKDEYVVDVQKIPYFASFSNFQRLAGRDAGHEEIPFFDIIHYCVENGYRHFFPRLPSDLSIYQDVCETLRFLAVDVLGGRHLYGLFYEMRNGEMLDWCFEEGRGVLRGPKRIAQDSAFRLVYLFLLGEPGVIDSNLAFTVALWVVSSRCIFEYKIRKMVREALEDSFEVTKKQFRQLDRWPIIEPWSEWKNDDIRTEVSNFD